MYKIVFIDLDGTLLNSKGEITEYTKNTLLEAQKRGIKVVLSSGRVSTSTMQFARQIGLNGYIISGNGSVITDLETNEEKLKELYNKLQEFYQNDQPFVGLIRDINYVISIQKINGDITGNNYFSFYNIANWSMK